MFAAGFLPVISRTQLGPCEIPGHVKGQPSSPTVDWERILEHFRTESRGYAPSHTQDPVKSMLEPPDTIIITSTKSWKPNREEDKLSDEIWWSTADEELSCTIKALRSDDMAPGLSTPSTQES
ncbi:hypothetical protein UY3_12714 [Chelonia mydas]|uniref:Uncharacterized protein n=1 Tax=Chelonia mydas TaxID=8469 RepID=M7B3T6_CHEMY|nr:hypothetical protein UY3_12714 [Chelonia mydas]